LTRDSAGTLYGTQYQGGTYGSGLAFKIVANANGGFTETTLYNFGASSTDAQAPYGPLTIDLSGNLYGVSLAGGTKGIGTVYRLTPPAGGTGSWTNSLLHSFAGGASGCDPEGNLALDNLGRVYGQATSCGGTSNNGLIFRLAPPNGSGPWVASVLHTFGSNDGGGFYPSLSLDGRAGILYGTSFYGGGNGLIFQLTQAAGGGTWTETVLHTFTGSADGGGPLGPMVRDTNGVLYGTGFQLSGEGVAFSIAP